MREEISAGGIVFRKIDPKLYPPSRRKYAAKAVEWLISQHSQHKGWVFPKGLVGDERQEEPTEEAALREVREEGGVVATIVAPLTKPTTYFYHVKRELIKKTVYYFLMEYVSGDPKDHDEEMMDAKFVSASQVEVTLTYDSDKQAFQDALELFKRKVAP